jgi:hypothetical protein
LLDCSLKASINQSKQATPKAVTDVKQPRISMLNALQPSEIMGLSDVAHTGRHERGGSHWCDILTAAFE